MARSRTFQVYVNKIRHTCLTCGNKRTFSVPPDARTRCVRCHKCGERERVGLNRRSQPREAQAGKVTLNTAGGSEIQTDLSDISPKGVGVIIPMNQARALRVRDVVHFTCSWNPRILTGNYEIRSIRGNRVGFASLRMM